MLAIRPAARQCTNGDRPGPPCESCSRVTKLSLTSQIVNRRQHAAGDQLTVSGSSLRGGSGMNLLAHRGAKKEPAGPCVGYPAGLSVPRRGPPGHEVKALSGGRKPLIERHITYGRSGRHPGLPLLTCRSGTTTAAGHKTTRTSGTLERVIWPLDWRPCAGNILSPVNPSRDMARCNGDWTRAGYLIVRVPKPI